MKKQFNIRAYGIVINDSNELLITHETRNNQEMIKLPGGGVEWGEGIIDGLKREFREELGWVIEVGELFYLTDFFQQSAFNPLDQVVSVYYLVNCENKQVPRQQLTHELIVFEWVPLSRLTTIKFTFPIDQVVVNKIITSISSEHNLQFSRKK